MKTWINLLPVIWIGFTTGGCSYRAQHLRTISLSNTTSIPSHQQTSRKLLIYPFEDLRGGEYSYIFPTTFIPPVLFFHGGFYSRYPEQSGIFRTTQGVSPVYTIGDLSSSIPFMIARMIRQMRLSPHATPLEEINSKTKISNFNFVIMGRIKKTKFSQEHNVFPLAFLAIFGAPFMFTSLTLEYEVLLFNSRNMSRPVFEKTYKTYSTKVVGLYYNYSAAYDMFVEGMELTLQQVVYDLSRQLRPRRNNRE